jgi:hypothetical protein
MEKIAIIMLLLLCPAVTSAHGNHVELLSMDWLHVFMHPEYLLILIMLGFVVGYRIYKRTCSRH